MPVVFVFILYSFSLWWPMFWLEPITFHFICRVYLVDAILMLEIGTLNYSFLFCVLEWQE